ncbi:MAG: hypothetical protein JWR26_3568 [Pedosphaera sp.]|nr:hypothetical protein [Pedosphaera sp.]
MKFNKWTLGLAAVGAVTLVSVAQAEEKTSSVLTAVSSTVLSGYVDTSAQWNMGTGDQFAPGYKYGGPTKADGFNLDVVKVTLEKPLDESEWAAGYKVDLFFGPDANFFPAGLGTASISSGFNADFAIKQAYVALRVPVANGIDVKVGVFDSIIGYESTEAVNNPNFTRSWAHTFEPSTHTGVLATYRVNSALAFSAGVADTLTASINDRPFNPTFGGNTKAESYKTYMGSVALTAPDSLGFLAGSTLYGGIVSGFGDNTPVLNGGQNADQTSFYVGATVATPVTGLRLGASYDYAGVNHQVITANQSAYFNSVAAYASFQATEKLSLHGRAEYVSMSKSTAAGFSGANGAGGIASKMVALTGTAQYDLWKNVISRLEFRWDHSADGTKAFGGSSSGFGGPTLKNSYILAANIIYKF